MTTTDLTARAMQLAESDLEFIRNEVNATCNTTRVIVDGTQYSPSWRALDGGFRVGRMGQNVTDVYTSMDIVEAYESTLDAGTDALGLYWEDGCLWAPEEEDDE